MLRCVACGCDYDGDAVIVHLTTDDGRALRMTEATARVWMMGHGLKPPAPYCHKHTPLNQVPAAVRN